MFEGEGHGALRVAALLTELSHEMSAVGLEDARTAMEAAGRQGLLSARDLAKVGRDLARVPPPEAIVSDIQRGSIDALLVVEAAAGYWILEKTLGASFSEAWKKSEAGIRLTSFLLRLFNTTIIRSQAQRLRQRLRRKLEIGTIDVRLLPGAEREEVVTLIATDREPPDSSRLPQTML